jgi:hypothetical protein
MPCREREAISFFEQQPTPWAQRADHLVEHDVASAEMSEDGAGVDEVEASGR